MTQEKIEVKIAGIWNYPDAKEPMKAMNPGDSYHYEAETSNPHDKNAIALYAVKRDDQGNNLHAPVRCGYLPKTLTATLTANRISAIVKGERFDSVIITLNGVSNE